MFDLGDSLTGLLQTVDKTLDDPSIMIMVCASLIIIGFMSSK